MNEEFAETLALQALSFVANDEDMLIAYLHLSGMTLESLKKSASHKETLASILDFLLQNEKRLLEFCQSYSIPPDVPAKARRLLPGGDEIPYST